jgi:hypothetical protein
VVAEHFFAKADENNEIMGIALSCKPKKLKIQLWIRGSEERSTKAIGKHWKEQVLQLPQQQMIEFLVSRHTHIHTHHSLKQANMQ